jgi:hypothetical protein
MYKDNWPMSVAPTIGKSVWLTEKYKLGKEKILMEPFLQKHTLFEGKNSKIFVT